MNDECAAVSEWLADLALGVLAGEERTAAVAHLERCPRCSRLVAELSAASNELLHLAPAAEPPVGFEARVFERLGLSQPVAPARDAVGGRQRLSGQGWLSRRRLSRRRHWGGRAPFNGDRPLSGRGQGRRAGRGRLAGAVGAIAAVVALAFGGGMLAGGGLTGSGGAGSGGASSAGGGVASGGVASGGVASQGAGSGAAGRGAGQAARGTPGYYRPGASGVLETAALFSWGRPVGKVFVYRGNPTWVFIYMDDGTWTGALRCQVVEERGPTVTLGTFWLSGGKGAWAASLNQPSGRLRSARVVDASGHVLAVARLS